MKKVTDDIFHLCLGPDNDWAGQNVIFIRLTEVEKKLLMDNLEREFH